MSVDPPVSAEVRGIDQYPMGILKMVEDGEMGDDRRRTGRD